MQEWLRDVYTDVLQYGDPGTDILDRIQESFRTYEPQGQRKSMAALFVGLWQYAGLPIAGSDNGGTTRRSTPSQPRRRTQTTKRKKTDQLAPIDDLPPGLVGLLREIPKVGTWTQDRRDAFVGAFEAMLDFTVRIDNSPPSDDNAESEISDEEASP